MVATFKVPSDSIVGLRSEKGALANVRNAVGKNMSGRHTIRCISFDGRRFAPR